MAKFIRLNKDESIAEIISIDEISKEKCEEKFGKMFHSELAKKFKYYPNEKVAIVGQVKNGNNFIDRIAPKKTEEAKKRESKSKIAHLERQSIALLLDYVVTLPTCPDNLKDLHAKIQVEKDKL